MLLAKMFHARDNKRRTGPFRSQSHTHLTGLRRTPLATRAGSQGGRQCTPALDPGLAVKAVDSAHQPWMPAWVLLPALPPSLAVATAPLGASES